MGIRVSKLRKTIAQTVIVEEKIKTEERVNILEKMVSSHLDSAKNSILRKENKHGIHTVIIVEIMEQVSILTAGEINSGSLEDSIRVFLGNDIGEEYIKLANYSVKDVLGNSTAGEHNGSSMLLVSTYSTLLQWDAYFYQWNFTSDEVIADIVGVSGVLLIQRVVDINKTDPEKISKVLSNQAKILEMLGNGIEEPNIEESTTQPEPNEEESNVEKEPVEDPELEDSKEPEEEPKVEPDKVVDEPNLEESNTDPELNEATNENVELVEEPLLEKDFNSENKLNAEEQESAFL